MSENTETTKPEVMREAIESDYSSRMVKLSGDYELPVVEMFASMDEHTCDLMRVSSNKKSKMFRLNAEEMDMLVSAWVQFRVDCAKAKAAAAKHAEETNAQAFKIVEECGGAIKIVVDRDGDWHITMEKVPFSNYAYNPDQLLQCVTEARDEYQQHKKNIDEVKQIVEQHPEIKVKTYSYNNTAQKTWTVSIPSQNWESYRMGTSNELLDTVKYALTRLTGNDNATQPLPEPATPELF